MGWYDLFSHFYDVQLEGLYRPWRSQSLAQLPLQPGEVVMDLACGTGQNLDLLEPGPGGKILGVDLSEGMLKAAAARVEKKGWHNVILKRQDVLEITPDLLQEWTGQPYLDHVVCTLGLSVIPPWQEVFHHSFGLLREGGTYLILDAHAESRTPQTWMVEWMARADLRRKVWEPLQGCSRDFHLEKLAASPWTFGGHLYLAMGKK